MDEEQVTTTEETKEDGTTAVPAADFKEGDRVRVFIDPPADVPQEATIKVVQDEAGKKIGIELDHFVDGAHSLDGVVEERVDNVRGMTVGKGYWTLPENIEKV